MKFLNSELNWFLWFSESQTEKSGGNEIRSALDGLIVEETISWMSTSSFAEIEDRTLGCVDKYVWMHTYGSHGIAGCTEFHKFVWILTHKSKWNWLVTFDTCENLDIFKLPKNMLLTFDCVSVCVCLYVEDIEDWIVGFYF